MDVLLTGAIDIKGVMSVARIRSILTRMARRAGIVMGVVVSGLRLMG